MVKLIARFGVFSSFCATTLGVVSWTYGQQPAGQPPVDVSQRDPASSERQPAAADASVSSTRSVPTTPDAAARERLWNSPEMVRARDYVREYSRRSKQFRPRDAEVYLAKLYQMSPGDMQKWLDRFTAKQANWERSVAAARAGRQIAVENALSRQEAVQQSYANLKYNQNEGAALSGARIQRQFQTGWEIAGARDSLRTAQAEQMLVADYSWVAFPNLYTRMAASASLPGDLPPGDPNNFIRGDVPGPEVNASGAAPAAGSAAFPGTAGAASAGAGASGTAGAASGGGAASGTGGGGP